MWDFEGNCLKFKGLRVSRAAKEESIVLIEVWLSVQTGASDHIL